MIEGSAIAAVITNPRMPDNPIIACNDAFVRLTGYERAEILGRNCRFLAGTDPDPVGTAILRSAISMGQPAMAQLRNYRKDGTPFLNAVMIAPIFDKVGDLDYFLGSQVEVVSDRDGIGDFRRGKAVDLIKALSPRQHQILVEMAAGKSSKSIAFELGLAERTVKMHRAALLRALGVGTSVEAIRIAIEAGY